jgi:hypothetical protein
LIVFSVATTGGTLSLNTKEIERMGVDESFWVCLGVVYGGFLEEREVGDTSFFFFFSRIL